MKFKIFSGTAALLFIAALAACGGRESPTPNNLTPSLPLTVNGTAATGLAIAGATVTGKCKVGMGTATTLPDGTFTLAIADGQFPCILQVVNPIDNTKLHTLVPDTEITTVANITQLTELTTARVLGSEPNVFYATFDAAADTQKVSAASIVDAQTAISMILTGTVDTSSLGDFISTPFVAATQGNPTSGDAQAKLLDALKLKLTSAQLALVATALTTSQTTDAIRDTVIALTTARSIPPVANAGAEQSVTAGTTVTLDASTSSAAAGKALTYVWTLNSKPINSDAILTGSTAAKPSFIADSAGSYVASVIVNDGTTASSASAVTLIASVENAAPVANAGLAQNVIAGSEVTLSGSGSSDANNDPLTFAWILTEKPAGSSATLSSEITVEPTFTADMEGTYVASLVVNDGTNKSIIKTVCVTAVRMLYQWDFEGGLPIPSLKYEQASGQKHITIDTDPLNPENKVLKTIIPPGFDRAEVYLGESLYGKIRHFYADAAYGYSDATNTITDKLSEGSEVWIKLRVYKPQEQIPSNLKVSVVQFGPISNAVSYPGQSLGFAQLRLRYDTSGYKDRWNWRVFSNHIFTPFDIPSGDLNFVVKPYGAWETIILHSKYSTGSGGIIEVWKDGVKFVTQTGPNAIANNRIKIKWGLYLGQGNRASVQQTAYFDDITICGAGCSYELLSRQP